MQLFWGTNQASQVLRKAPASIKGLPPIPSGLSPLIKAGAHSLDVANDVRARMVASDWARAAVPSLIEMLNILLQCQGPAVIILRHITTLAHQIQPGMFGDLSILQTSVSRAPPKEARKVVGSEDRNFGE